MFNVRNSTLTSLEDIQNYVNQTLKGLEYTLTLSQSAKPFVTNAEASIVKAVEEALLHVKGIPLQSFITCKSSKRMNLCVGDSVKLLIKASELFVLEVNDV